MRLIGGARVDDCPGAVVAALLRGAWRDDPDTIDGREASMADDLRRCEPLLLGTGCGALVWRRIARSDAAALPEARPYRDAHRFQAVRAPAQRVAIGAVVRAVRETGVEPLVVKGWATARHYPEIGLRPFGDLDLVVPHGRRDAVERALLERRRATPTLALAPVDIHDSLDDLPDRSLDALRARATIEPLGDPAGTQVLVLSPEDHLRLLSLHLLRHGAWRPLWLCDVALLLEKWGDALDWDRCLRGTREDAHRVALVAGLAHHLLGAALPAALPRPAALDARRVPRWLLVATLRQWGRRYDRYTDDAMLAAGRSPRRLLAAARRRWPNAIEATVSVGAPFNALPRLPFQLADVARRTGRALAAAR